MPVPQTYKVKKGEITYESNVDRANYFIFELTRGALRDISKFLRKEYRARYYQQFKKRSGQGPKAITGKVFSSKNTVYPRLEIGIPHSHPGKEVKGFYTYFHELGTAKEPKRGVLRDVTYENIDQIREIEAHYLSAIEDEQEALALIDEEETEDETEV